MIFNELPLGAEFVYAGIRYRKIITNDKNQNAINLDTNRGAHFVPYAEYKEIIWVAKPYDNPYNLRD